jgi:uncharacterized damage-inducible protein DinB
MSFADSFLPEFDREMQTTRALLERVPLENATWKPHTRSAALGGLASHLANLAGFGVPIVNQDELDFAPPGSPAGAPVQAQYASKDELLGAFDRNVAGTRAAIQQLPDSGVATPWSLKHGGNVIFTLPRAAVLRTLMMNHIIHHRGQLSVYLRLNEVPLPSIYGPTADT